MRLVYFGSGAFGIPTLERLLAVHELALIVTQPDRPAGRKRVLSATPVGAWAQSRGLETLKPPNVNDADVVRRIRAIEADAWVVIAYGHKLGSELLDGVFAINLHGSLLPKYRGAAPINWAMMNGEPETGVSVIELASTMDAGRIYARRGTPIDPGETAGELHDRLALLGPAVILETLAAHEADRLEAEVQNESRVSQAPKLRKEDGTVRFDQPAARVRCMVHGLTPWPGCTVRIGESTLRLLRVEELDEIEEIAFTEESGEAADEPGTISADGIVRCRPGAIRLLSVQAPGGRPMSYTDYVNGHPVGSETRMCER